MALQEIERESVGTEDIEAVPPSVIGVMVVTGDEEFLSIINGAMAGDGNVLHAATLERAKVMLKLKPIGVVVIDVNFAGTNIEQLIRNLKRRSGNSVTLVAGRRRDDELLVDLYNSGAAYRFLVLPLSQNRIRIAVDACIRQHLHIIGAGIEQEGHPAERQVAIDGVAEPAKLAADRVVRQTHNNKAGDADDVQMQLSCATSTDARSSYLPMLLGFGLLLLMIAGITVELLGWVI